VNEMQKQNLLISLNKLRNYNNRINEKNIYKQRNKKIILYNKEVKKIMEKAEKMYIDIINKKDTEIKMLKKNI
jgi:hypothetical protein